MYLYRKYKSASRAAAIKSVSVPRVFISTQRTSTATPDYNSSSIPAKGYRIEGFSFSHRRLFRHIAVSIVVFLGAESTAARTAVHSARETIRVISHGVSADDFTITANGFDFIEPCSRTSRLFVSRVSVSITLLPHAETTRASLRFTL